MYKVNMHITPAKVRSTICDHLDKYDMELIHLSHASMLESDNERFILIAQYKVSDKSIESKCYAVYDFYPKKDCFFCRGHDLTYPEALMKMANGIKE